MISTGTGDEGQTSLVSGKRVYKDNIEIEVYGTLDELLAYLGYAYSKIQDERVKKDILKIMNDIHNLIPEISKYSGKISKKTIEWLEQRINKYNKILKPINTFLIEISSESAAIINISRVVCRRAERRLITLSKEKPIQGEIITYINRLSDLLFVLYRYLNTIEEIKEMPYEKYLEENND